jgi:hypothetical protein
MKAGKFRIGGVTPLTKPPNTITTAIATTSTFCGDTSTLNRLASDVHHHTTRRPMP